MANRKLRPSLTPATSEQLPRPRRMRRVDVFADDLDPRTERRYELLRRVMEEPPVAQPPHPRWLIRA
jgi:hypothetical protein